MSEQAVTAYDVWGQQERAPLRRLPSLLRDALRLVREAAPRDARLVVVLQAVAALGAVAQVLVGRGVLEAVTVGDRSGQAVAGVAALAAVTAAVGAVQALSRERDQLLGELVSRHAQGRILDVAAAVELAAFETPELHNRLQRASVSAQYGPLQLVNGVVALVAGVLGTVTLVLALLALQPLLVVVAVLAAVPLTVSSIRRGRLYYDFLSNYTPTERERSYLHGLLTDREVAKEVRAFALAPLLRGRWDRLSDQRVAELRRVVRAQLRLTLLGGLGGSVLFGASLALLALLLTSGRLSLAEGGAAAGALLLLGGRIQGAGIGADLLFEAAPFVQDLRAFLAVGDEVGRRRPTAPAPGGFGRITADGVGFTYPSGSEPALHDVSLELDVGEVIALVGENGSGKTTLAKLLAGLYVPDEGSIRWDGADTAAVAPEALRDQVAILFQDFLRYHVPARDNIGFGRPDRADDLDAIVAAARSAGADGFLAGLPGGYDTVLGPEFFGGTDLSGGQWQRVALARAYFRDASLVILDEPTAALDARAEHDLFASVRELCRGRTVILISHRFASVRTADRTYVLHEGRVVESGSHDQLMALDGRYAELYTLQSEPYVGPGAGGQA